MKYKDLKSSFGLSVLSALWTICGIYFIISGKPVLCLLCFLMGELVAIREELIFNRANDMTNITSNVNLPANSNKE